MALPQLPIFFSYFGNAIDTFGFPCALTLRAPTRAVGMGRRNFGDVVAKNQKFLSPTFFFLSPTFVEFRQWYC